MKQIDMSEINGKTIADYRMYADYITLLFDDNTFIHCVYDFDYDDGVGFWGNCYIDKYIDEQHNVKSEYTTSCFWVNYNTDDIVPERFVQGPYELGIIKCEYNSLKDLIEKRNKAIKIERRQSFIELAEEFGIKLTDEQLKEMENTLNNDLK